MSCDVSDLPSLESTSSPILRGLISNVRFQRVTARGHSEDRRLPERRIGVARWENSASTRTVLRVEVERKKVRILNRLLSLTTALFLILAAATPGIALAAAGGHGGGGFHGGSSAHSGFRGHVGHPGFVGHPGHRFVGHHGFFRGGGFVVVPGFGFYGGYPYPYYDGTAAYPDYWYYCQSAGGYYPYVSTCPEPWVPVPAG